MEIKIRNEESIDAEQARAILIAAFPTDSESKIVDALRANSKAIISLFAVDGNQVLGHSPFSPVSTTPPSDAKGIGFAPVAICPNVQSQGIGSQLITRSSKIASLRRTWISLLCCAW